MKSSYIYVRLSNLSPSGVDIQGSADFEPHCTEYSEDNSVAVAVNRVNYERSAVVTPAINQQLFVLINDLNVKNFAIRPASNNQTNKSSVVYAMGNMGDPETFIEEDPFEKVFYDMENNSTSTFNSMFARIVDERGAPATSFLTGLTSIDLIFEVQEGLE